jgi:hypothetical protein
VASAASPAFVDLDAGPAPDYAEPVEAWRVWRVVTREGRIVLKSLFVGAVWEPGLPLVASCTAGHRSWRPPWRKKPNDHAAPDLECGCGIYGVQSIAAARSYLERPPLLCRDDRVIGRVALWGNVVECTSGWRASHAYPIELFVPTTVVAHGLRQRGYVEEILLALEAYGVPVDVAAPNALSAS